MGRSTKPRGTVGASQHGETPRNSTDRETIDALAHQMNQPLAAIVAVARGCQLRARNQTLEPQDLDRALDNIAQEALRAGTTLRTLLETITERK